MVGFVVGTGVGVLAVGALTGVVPEVVDPVVDKLLPNLPDAYTEEAATVWFTASKEINPFSAKN